MNGLNGIVDDSCFEIDLFLDWWFIRLLQDGYLAINGRKSIREWQLLRLSNSEWIWRGNSQVTYLFIAFTLRAIFAWPWNGNARTKQKQQTNGNRAIWLVYRTDTNARGLWLVKRTLGWKNFMPENFLQIKRYFAWRHTATRLANQTTPSPYKGFLWRENEESMFWSFHPFADKTNNEPLPKPFFKVIRKSL